MSRKSSFLALILVGSSFFPLDLFNPTFFFYMKKKKKNVELRTEFDQISNYFLGKILFRIL